MPNALAYLALFSWPVAMLILLIRLPLDKALIWSLLGAYLLLPPEPASIEFPLVRSLNKETFTVIMFSVLVLWRHGAAAFSLPRNWLTRALMAVFVISPLFTVLNNGEPLVFVEGLVVPGLKCPALKRSPSGAAKRPEKMSEIACWSIRSTLMQKQPLSSSGGRTEDAALRQTSMVGASPSALTEVMALTVMP